jgi:hypothetical protein
MTVESFKARLALDQNKFVGLTLVFLIGEYAVSTGQKLKLPMMATLMMQMIWEDGGRNVQSMHCQVAFAIHSDTRKKKKVSA